MLYLQVNPLGKSGKAMKRLWLSKVTVIMGRIYRYLEVNVMAYETTNLEIEVSKLEQLDRIASSQDRDRTAVLS